MDDRLKREILARIYGAFADWSGRFELACSRGCAVCCTRDVLITRPEALLIIDWAIGRHGARWLAEKLGGDRHHHHPLSRTTNEYAADCLAGREVAEGDERRGGSCPFLEDDQCTIYPARPFSCRCFGSTRVCRDEVNALLPGRYLSAATAVSQIIEHLGQSGCWGNMLDVLYLLAPPAVTDQFGESYAENRAVARANCRTARPLPGFLIEDEAADEVALLLEMIFNSRIGGKRVEDLLNNR